ncbi:CopG family antitoxin [Acetobacter senegalensis]|uniref:CopG family antitoxin n=1 Tax=Acetobacter senegalensis TaxID=446692 RepID=UPI00264E3EE6|nr:CopG family antitoxin [Acetobacter senegalensis]MDN7351856.1 CopG family antitoxin [Acetobacter senegalensis]
MSSKNRSMLSLHSDEAAEDFVATADLTRYDLSGFRPTRFEIEPKAAALNMRLPASLLETDIAQAR